jgi:hypothetical protein
MVNKVKMFNMDIIKNHIASKNNVENIEPTIN